MNIDCLYACGPMYIPTEIVEMGTFLSTKVGVGYREANGKEVKRKPLNKSYILIESVCLTS